MSKKIKSCPFCGRKDLVKLHMDGTILHPAYKINCEFCGASTSYTDKDCSLDWNTRPIEDALQAENARLKQTIISLEVNCDSQSKANYEIKDKYLTVIEKIQNKNNDFKSTLEYVQGWLNKCSNDKKTMSAHKAVKQFVDQVLNNKDNYNEK